MCDYEEECAQYPTHVPAFSSTPLDDDHSIQGLIDGGHSWISNTGVNNGKYSASKVFTDEEQEAWNRLWADDEKPDEHPLRAYRFITKGV
jgi:hypothetical protein